MQMLFFSHLYFPYIYLVGCKAVRIMVTPIKGWRMVKSETRRDVEILVRKIRARDPLVKIFETQKSKTNHEKTRLRDLSKTLPRFRDPAKIFRDPRFSRYYSAPLY